MRKRLRDSTVEALIVLSVLTVAGVAAIAGVTVWLVNYDGGTASASATQPAETQPAETTGQATTEAPTTAEATTAEVTTNTEEQATTGAEGGEGDPAAGKEVFASAGCGSCHTLSDAGTNGNIGPNLDDAKPSYDLVVERVTHGQGAMPAFGDQGVLDAQQIQDVAAYVSQATAG